MIHEVHDPLHTRVDREKHLPPGPKTFKFLGVAGGTIENRYSPYVNTEGHQEGRGNLPRGRTAARAQAPSGRDRKQERSFSGLRHPSAFLEKNYTKGPGETELEIQRYIFL